MLLGLRLRIHFSHSGHDEIDADVPISPAAAHAAAFAAATSAAASLAVPVFAITCDNEIPRLACGQCGYT